MVADGVEVGEAGVPTHAVSDVDCLRRGAFVLVEIVDRLKHREPGIGGGVEEEPLKRGQFVVGVGPDAETLFGREEVLEHGVCLPAGIPEFDPVVVVAAVAADLDRAVVCGAAADDAGSLERDLASRDELLARVTPIVGERDRAGIEEVGRPRRPLRTGP